MLLLTIVVAVFAALLADRGLDALIELRIKNKNKRQVEKSIKSAFDGLLEQIKEYAEHDGRLQKALIEATQEVVGNRPPKVSEFKKVEARFHELAGDHYLKLSATKGGKPDVEISDKPFKAQPTVKKAPVKKSVVKQTLENIPKPTTTKKPVTTKKGK